MKKELTLVVPLVAVETCLVGWIRCGAEASTCLRIESKAWSVSRFVVISLFTSVSSRVSICLLADTRPPRLPLRVALRPVVRCTEDFCFEWWCFGCRSEDLRYWCSLPG